MNSNQLYHFKTIAECGNITKAAEVLYITQPALSTSLRKLEEEVARPLFIREGRNLRLTENGKVLLNYAQIVTDAIERAEEYFSVREDSHSVNLYRIGGVAGNLLTEECFTMKGFRLNCLLVSNQDLVRIASSGVADIIIADDRYLKNAAHKYTERELLYHQHLILSVLKDDPLVRLNEVNVKDLNGLSMLGHVNPLGFAAWIDEIKRDNRCDFVNEIALDNMTYFAERDKLPWPVFISSFGIGTERGRDYFAKRKSIKVTGRYTERDIYIWYNKKSLKRLKPLIEKIKSNAQKTLELDNASGYL
ncbi:MAG: LysR family transcriptional regulator [Clostridium sp.]|nr:LysR family transcriptional regulator [Clostridium sp.]